MSANNNGGNGVKTITYLNADGSGFAEKVEVPAGFSFGDFFALKKPGENASSYAIRVSRDGNKFTPEKGQLIEDGDKVSILAAKQEGAII